MSRAAGRFYRCWGHRLRWALSWAVYEYSLNDELFLAQSSIIEQLAEKGPCILIGRCADYVLEDRDDVLNVFICADLKSRLARVIDEYHVEDADEGMLKKVDKRRSNYYQYYTDRVWGRADNYDLCINTGKFTPEEVTENDPAGVSETVMNGIWGSA
ncbi:MAG: AAA family ATPase, partial [Merdibacter sp.]